MKNIFKSKQSDDQILVTRLIQGDSSTFDQVVTKHHNVMLSVARAIVGEAFADEVVQDAWISAIKALPNFKGRSSLKTWLLHITSNGAKSRVKRENRHISLEDDWESVSADHFDPTGHRLNNIYAWEQTTPETLLANEQLQSIIEENFQRLPVMQRAVLTMYDMEDIKTEEICNILDISASNVRVLLHRARTTLHHSIEKYQNGE